MRKILILITLVVLAVFATACERSGLAETAVPNGWLLRMLWPSATAAPAAEGWGWMREALAARVVPILIGLLILVVVFMAFFAASLGLTRKR